jgi:hypothetical protein
MRCRHIVKDSHNKQKRLCKNLSHNGEIYCSKHGSKFSKSVTTESWSLRLRIIEGVCCFCGSECNINSQSCGRCSRKLIYHI